MLCVQAALTGKLSFRCPISRRSAEFSRFTPGIDLIVFYCYCLLRQAETMVGFCSKMSLADDVNLDEFVMTKDDLSGADIKAICTESGLLVRQQKILDFMCCFETLCWFRLCVSGG